MKRISRLAENDAKSYRLAMGEYPIITKSDLSTLDARRSRPVSYEEFQQLAGEGDRRMQKLKSQKLDTSALDNNWDSIVQHAYDSTRTPWGGATYNATSGRALQGNEDMYAITARDAGKNTVSVPKDATPQEFHRAMTNAKTVFAPELSRPGHHLGVFHDADKGTIDFDPAYVTKDKSDVETIGAYTHNVGGAYHFRSGDGYWPPHVAGA